MDEGVVNDDRCKKSFIPRSRRAQRTARMKQEDGKWIQERFSLFLRRRLFRVWRVKPSSEAAIP